MSNLGIEGVLKTARGTGLAGGGLARVAALAFRGEFSLTLTHPAVRVSSSLEFSTTLSQSQDSTSPKKKHGNSINMSLTNCRFYEEKYPEVESFVMVNVKQIAEMGAYVKLLEYGTSLHIYSPAFRADKL